MCGIVAYLSQETAFNKKYEDMIRDMIIVDTVRGYDSTGIMYEDPKSTFTLKKAMPGYDFVQLRQVRKALASYNKGRYFVGHNRAATVGTVDADTAHPFMFDNVTGVHNGTLQGTYRQLVKEHHAVDSEYIFAGLDQTENSKDVIKKLQGSFMLLWYDARDDSIHMVRNDQRPFALAQVKGKNTIFGCSEAGMLEWLAARHGIEIMPVQEISPYHEHVFDLDNLCKPKVIKHEKYNPPVYNAPKNHNYSNKGHSYGGGRHNGKKNGEVIPLSTGPKQITNASTKNTSTKSGGVSSQDPVGMSLIRKEFVIEEFIKNIVTTNPDIVYGAYQGSTIDNEPVILFNAIDGEFTVGKWYEGMANPRSIIEGRMSIRRETVKNLDTGTKGEIYNCRECKDMKYISEILFIDKKPVCFPCAQVMNVEADQIELTPPPKSEVTK